MESKILEIHVEPDEFTSKITKCFDYEFNGTSTFTCWNKPEVGDYQIGLIVGSSGSGKTTLLKEFGKQETISWDNTKCIASNFSSPEEAIDKLGAVGLNSIPTWCKPYNVLSNGEAFRADLARKLKDNTVIDEFTSVVDRSVAKSCSVSISKYIRNNNLKNITIATCHKDIIEWLQPDWVFDTDIGELLPRGAVRRRPEIKLDIYETDYKTWELFKKHHYLSADINKACRCCVAMWGDIPVAFNASISFPCGIPPLYEGDTRKKFRESRLVVLPDYQGMGIGTKFSNAIGEKYLNDGYRYFSKTAHIRMGNYRQKSDLWRPTSTNLKNREKDIHYIETKNWHGWALSPRLCYSHEYIGKKDNQYRIKYEEFIDRKGIK